MAGGLNDVRVEGGGLRPHRHLVWLLLVVSLVLLALGLLLPHGLVLAAGIALVAIAERLLGTERRRDERGRHTHIGRW